MMKHPWMTMDIEKTKTLANHGKLQKYMSIRKEKSYKNKKDDQPNMADDDDAI
jgi:hypothetical protein